MPSSAHGTAHRTFSIGLVQAAVTGDAAANVRHTVTSIREAAGRGAQIVCLQELFNSLYFCQAQRGERFDIAEPIPGPTTDAMQALARELAVVIIVPLFERQAP